MHSQSTTGNATLEIEEISFDAHGNLEAGNPSFKFPSAFTDWVNSLKIWRGEEENAPILELELYAEGKFTYDPGDYMTPPCADSDIFITDATLKVLDDIDGKIEQVNAIKVPDKYIKEINGAIPYNWLEENVQAGWS